MKPDTSQDRLAFRILNNTAAFIGGEFFYHFVNFLAGIVIARSLGSQAYGMFSFIFVYLSFFEIFIQFGMNAIIQRELSQKKDQTPHILGNAILLRLILMAVTMPVAFVLIRWMGYPLSVQEGVFLASFQLFLGLRSIFEAIFRVNLLMIYPAAWNGLRALLNLALVGGIAYFYPYLPLFILAYLVSGMGGLIGIAIFSRRFVKMTFRWDSAFIKDLIRQSAPLMASGYLTLLYYRIDVFMLSKMKNFSDVGYYSVATRLTEALDVVAAALTASVFPLLAHSFKENRPEFERLVSKTLSVLLLGGVPMALGGFIVAHDLMVFFFGPEYSRSAGTLAILFWYSCFGFLSTFLVNLLIICGKQIVDVWISFALILLNVGMNFVLIPPYSHYGAALATVLTEIFGLAFMMTYAARQREIRLPFPKQELGLTLKLNFIFLGILAGLKAFPLPFYFFIPIAAASYGALILAMKIVSVEDCKNYLASALKNLSGLAS